MLAPRAVPQVLYCCRDAARARWGSDVAVLGGPPRGQVFRPAAQPVTPSPSSVSPAVQGLLVGGGILKRFGIGVLAACTAGGVAWRLSRVRVEPPEETRSACAVTFCSDAACLPPPRRAWDEGTGAWRASRGPTPLEPPVLLSLSCKGEPSHPVVTLPMCTSAQPPPSGEKFVCSYLRAGLRRPRPACPGRMGRSDLPASVRAGPAGQRPGRSPPVG